LYPSELANSVTTFWNRLIAADHLGASDGVLRRLLAGLSQRLAGARAGAKADRRSSLLVVGHSMGARAVFNALRPDLLRTDAAPASLQADLGLLVNPAFSANLFRAVHQQSRDCRQGTTPLLLFSSETDGVTRQLYPAGQTVTYPYADAEPVPFFEHIYTAANFVEFVTHRLILDPMNGDPPDVDGPQSILRGFERTPAGSKELYQDNPVTVYRQPANGRPAAADAWYRMRLVRCRLTAPSCDAAAGTSKVIAVDPRILPDPRKDLHAAIRRVRGTRAESTRTGFTVERTLQRARVRGGERLRCTPQPSPRRARESHLIARQDVADGPRCPAQTRAAAAASSTRPCSGTSADRLVPAAVRMCRHPLERHWRRRSPAMGISRPSSARSEIAATASWSWRRRSLASTPPHDDSSTTNSSPPYLMQVSYERVV
jgi:hypothetical protein